MFALGRRLPDSVDVGSVWIGDQLQGGVHGGQREHASVEGLLWEGVVGGVVLPWHHIHWNGGLTTSKKRQRDIRHTID